MNEERKEEVRIDERVGNWSNPFFQSSGEECRGQTTPMAIVAPNPRSIDSGMALSLLCDRYLTHNK